MRAEWDTGTSAPAQRPEVEENTGQRDDKTTCRNINLDYFGNTPSTTGFLAPSPSSMILGADDGVVHRPNKPNPSIDRLISANCPWSQPSSTWASNPIPQFEISA